MWQKAKRAVSAETARAIAEVARQGGAKAVGVFVDEDAATISQRYTVLRHRPLLARLRSNHQDYLQGVSPCRTAIMSLPIRAGQGMWVRAIRYGTMCAVPAENHCQDTGVRNNPHAHVGFCLAGAWTRASRWPSCTGTARGEPRGFQGGGGAAGREATAVLALGTWGACWWGAKGGEEKP